MVDFGLALNALVAVGTLGLAAGAFFSIRQNGRQIRTLARQTLILKAQNAPIILVREFHFTSNRVRLSIQNMGGSPVSSLVLSSGFLPAKRAIFDKQKDGRPLKPDEVKQSISEKKQLYQRFEMLIPPQFRTKDGKVTPVDTAKFLVHPLRKDNILMPGETITYEVEPTFGLRFIKPPPYWQGVRFADLKSSLEENGISAVAVRLDIMAKDWSEELLQPQDIANFIVDFAKEQTLEDGSKSNRRPYFEPLSRSEFISTLGALETETWRTSRSPQYSPFSFEEEL